MTNINATYVTNYYTDYAAFSHFESCAENRHAENPDSLDADDAKIFTVLFLAF